MRIRRQGGEGSGVWDGNPKAQDLKSEDFEPKPASLESWVILTLTFYILTCKWSDRSYHYY